MLRLQELGLEHSLLIFDRWYPSTAFMAYILSMGYSFIIRVRKKWNLDVDGIQTQDWIDLRHQKQDYRVRVLKIKLATGETETLLTNLNQKTLPIAKTKELYFKRWGVETAFDLLKSKLQLENFSGKSVVAIQQDFYASVFLASFANVLMSVTDEMIEQADMGMRRKYKRKSSQNRTVAKLRRAFLELFLCKNDRKRERLYSRLCEDIAARPEEIRPDRHAPRSIPRKLRFPIAKKAVLP